MLFIVRFHDNPKRRDIRTHHMQGHLEWLALHRNKVLVAGSLREDPDAAPLGAMWIVDANDRAEVDALMRTDPFWLHGLRLDCEILHWSKAFAETVAV